MDADSQTTLQTEFNPDVVELMNCNVLNENGEAISVANLWSKQTAILVFLRHFACIECRTIAKQVWSDREKYEKAGGRIYFIGNGQPNFISGFKSDLNINDAPIYTDPSLKIFNAAGFKRGFFVALGPQSIVNGLKMFAGGNSQGQYEKGMGDIWQMGGVIVVKPNGRVAFKFVSQKLGDFPPEKDIAQ